VGVNDGFDAGGNVRVVLGGFGGAFGKTKDEFLPRAAEVRRGVRPAAEAEHDHAVGRGDGAAVFRAEIPESVGKIVRLLLRNEQDARAGVVAEIRPAPVAEELVLDVGPVAVRSALVRAPVMCGR